MCGIKKKKKKKKKKEKKERGIHRKKETMRQKEPSWN